MVYSICRSSPTDAAYAGLSGTPHRTDAFLNNSAGTGLLLNGDCGQLLLSGCVSTVADVVPGRAFL